MSSRVSGAGLALIAVALLAVSIVTPAVLPAPLSLFAGHPTVAEHTRATQDVYVGFFTAELCNSGGDGKCSYGDARTGFRILGYAELGATGLLVLSSVALALLTLRKSERRKTVAWAVWTSGALALVGGAAMIVHGPFNEATVPLGIGMAVHGAGILGAVIAGAIAVRPPPPLRLRVADRARSSAAVLPAAQAFDRRAPRGGDLQRPGQLGPEPRIGADAGRPVPSALDGDADVDPFGTPNPAERSGFSPAPQLRPLYDAAPTHGGTGGLLPIERPVMPTRPPTPLSRDQISAVAGIPAPPAFPAEEPHPPRPLGADEPTLAAPFIDPRLPPPRAEPRPTPSPPVATEPRSRPSPSTFPVNRQFPPVEPRSMPPAVAAEPRPMPPPFADHRPPPPFAEPRSMPPAFPAESRPMPPPPPVSAEQRPFPPPFAGEVPSAPPFAIEPPTTPSAGPDEAPASPPTEERPVPPRPAARTKPPSFAPPMTGPPASPPGPPPPPPPGQAGAKPRTQVSLVPPMPDNDLPIAPPTAQIATQPSSDAARSSADSTLFPRAETPLAAPPAPVAPPPRAHRDSQLPPPRRGAPTTRPPLRASVPMPVRPVRPASSTSPPPGALPAGPSRTAAPRPTIPTAVPPIPAIPAIPPIPAIPVIPAIPPLPAHARAETDTTDPEGHAVVRADPDQATVSRVPIEITDNSSQTNVSVDMPSPEEIDAAVHGISAGDVASTLDDSASGNGDAAGASRAGYVLDTSPTGQPVVEPADPLAFDAGIEQPTIPADELLPTTPAEPRLAASSAQPRLSPVIPVAAPPLSPQLRDRPMPKLPISTAPDSLPPPRDNKQSAGPSPACPQCESPMAWVEEHLRFYCKSCRMYF